MLDWLMNRSTHQPPMSRPLMIVPCGRVTIILFQSRPSRACRVYGWMRRFEIHMFGHGTRLSGSRPIRQLDGGRGHFLHFSDQNIGLRRLPDGPGRLLGLGLRRDLRQRRQRDGRTAREDEIRGGVDEPVPFGCGAAVRQFQQRFCRVSLEGHAATCRAACEHAGRDRTAVLLAGLLVRVADDPALLHQSVRIQLLRRDPVRRAAVRDGRDVHRDVVVLQVPEITPVETAGGVPMPFGDDQGRSRWLRGTRRTA